MDYIGARYTVKIYENSLDPSSAEWEANVNYEPITMVTFNNGSYLSKKEVAANIGNPADNPDYWVQTGFYNGQILDLQQQIDAIKNGFATPELFGAVGDGVTDDTAAFVSLAGADFVFIPENTYLINSRIILKNVIEDRGQYVNYKPDYEKSLALDLVGLCTVKEYIPLAVDHSYEEAICYHNHKYYMVSNEYDTPDTTGLTVFDDDFNVIDHYTINDVNHGVANNCCTDGTFLYIDFDGNYHKKFDLNDLTTPVVSSNASYNYTAYDNKQLYAITLYGAHVTVSKLDDTLTNLTDSWMVAFSYGTLQSGSIINGRCYILTDFGNYAVIDMVTHKLNVIPYNNLPDEIECFFEVDGEMFAAGHNVATGGAFNIKAFNNGIDSTIYRMVEIDTNNVRFGPTQAAARNDIYHVLNGKTNGYMPSDDCVVLWMNKILICYSVVDNGIWYYAINKWLFLNPLVAQTYNIASGLDLVLEASGSLRLKAGYTTTSGTETFSADLSALYSKLGLADGETIGMYLMAHTPGMMINNTSCDVYGVYLIIGKTLQAIYVRSLLGIDATVNCNITGSYYLK